MKAPPGYREVKRIPMDAEDVTILAELRTAQDALQKLTHLNLQRIGAKYAAAHSTDVDCTIQFDGNDAVLFEPERVYVPA